MFEFSKTCWDIGIRKFVILYRIRPLFAQSESEYFLAERKSENKEAENYCYVEGRKREQLAWCIEATEKNRKWWI